MMQRVTRGGKTYVARGDKLIEIVSADDPRVTAPTKRSKVEPFVMVPWRWVALTAKAAHSPTTLVLMELLYMAWKTRSSTFPLSNARLKKLGVSRQVKRKALLALERAGLARVVWRHGKTPTVTLLGL